MKFDENYVDYATWKRENLEYLRKIRFPASLCSLWDAVECGVISLPSKMFSTEPSTQGNTYMPMWAILRVQEAWIIQDKEWKRIRVS